MPGQFRKYDRLQYPLKVTLELGRLIGNAVWNYYAILRVVDLNKKLQG